MSNYSANKLVDDPNHVWSKILTIVPEGSEVLDIGCSSGNLGRVLIDQKHCQVDGIEPDPGDARKAAKHLRQVWELNIEEPETIRQLDKRYDVLIFADVLEHLYDPAAVLRSVGALVKPSGMVVFSIPNMGHISIRLALLEGAFSYTETGVLDQTHLHFYDIHHIKTIFMKAGMSIRKLDSSSFQYSPRLITSKLRALGFEVTDKGMKLLNEPEAAAFQYVGYAQYDKNPKPPKFIATTQAIQKDVENLSNQLQASEKKVAELQGRLISSEAEQQRLQQQLHDLVRSKMFRAAETAVRPYRVIRTRIGSAKRKGKAV